MKKLSVVLFAGAVLLCDCASASDDQLPSSPSPTVSTSNDATSNPADNPTPVTTGGYVDTSATAHVH